MSKKKKFVLITVCAVLVLGLSLGVGCDYIEKLVPVQESPTSQSQARALSTVEQAWDIIFSDYVEKNNIDPNQISQAAIKGMVEALNDPYTTYLEPDFYRLGVSNIEGNFEGIGAHVGMRDAQIIIVAPIPGGPAEKAGIRSGDVLLEVNGQSVEGMSLEKVILLVRGPKDTTVSLLIKHEGEDNPVEIQVVREEIHVSTVYSETRGDVLYIKITDFSKSTDTELTEVLQNIAGDKFTGIVLDLRDNPGGLLSTVVDVASHFIKEGAVVTVVDNDEEQTVTEVKKDTIISDLPIVVLVNENSASGSEVLAGALQDYGRAVVAGTKTYGKGSVNILRSLQDGSGIYITTGRWLTPKGRSIEGVGIEPDFVLEQTGEDVVMWAMDYLRSHYGETVAFAGVALV